MEHNKLSSVFGLISSQLIYVLCTPLFFSIFLLIYEPFHLVDYLNMGADWYSFNLVIISAIIMVTLFITRTIFFFVYKNIVILEGWYIFYCCLEVIFCDAFISLYLWLMMRGICDPVVSYFSMMKSNLYFLSFILGLCYLNIGLALRVYHRKNVADDAVGNTLLKFSDTNKSVRLVVPRKDLLYVEAQENYVNICYIEKGKIKTYLLRNTMKSIENITDAHQLVRCHRSYFINAQRVKILRKDKDGIIHAELDAPESLNVQVSKRYYDALSELL